MIDVCCAIIVEEGKVLLAQNRADSDHPLQWEFPGGKVHPGEAVDECIRREIREELELGIDVIRKLEAVEFDYGKKQIRLIPFVCRIAAGSMRLNDHENSAWVSLAELPGFDMSAADRALIRLDSNLSFLKKYIGKQVDKT